MFDASFMGLLSLSAAGRVWRVLSDWRRQRKVSHFARPRSGKRKYEPACDQQCAAGGRSPGEEAMPGKLPQGQIGRKQGCSEHKARGDKNADPRMGHAALGERDRPEHRARME